MSKSAIIKHHIGFLSNLPVGCIIAWYRELNGTPELPPGWAECNGQKLDDPDSPYHDTDLPNLNAGGHFLRGGEKSGVFQTDQMQSHKHEDPGHEHTVQLGNNTGVGPDIWVQHSDPGGGDWGKHATSKVIANLGKPVQMDNQDIASHRLGAETRPLNMSVVWIIKIKQLTAAYPTQAYQAEVNAPQGALYVSRAGNVGIGTDTPEGKLEVIGDIRAGNSDIYFTKTNHNHTGFGNTSGFAAIENSANYDSLMILGRAGTSKGRYVRLWDYLQVNGGLDITGNVGIGTDSPEGKLEVIGDIRAGNSDIYFTKTNHNYTGFGNTSGFAAIENSANYDSLMILGRAGTSKGRYVRLWDYLQVNGGLDITGNVGIGTTSPDVKLEVREHGDYAANTGQILLRDPNNSQRGLTLGFEQKVGSIKGFIQTMPETVAAGGGYSTHLLLQPNGGNVGIGTAAPVYKLQTNGTSYASRRAGAGIDYAEYFQSSSGKSVAEGTAVVLDEGHIRKAKKGEEPFGIISANPIIVGGVHPEWPGKYLRDEFGGRIMEEYKEEVLAPKKDKLQRERQKVKRKKIKEQVTRLEVVKKGKKYVQKEVTETVSREVEEPIFKKVNLYDKAGKKVIGKHPVPVMETYEEEVDVLDEEGHPVMTGTGEFVTRQRPKLNPKYDDSKEYVPREKRPEWNCVGLLGQLPLRKGQPVAPTWVKIKDISDKVELWLVK